MDNNNLNKKSQDEPIKLTSDNLIIERILQGQTELFGILMRRHNQLLYRTVRGYLHIDADIEDTMQETYVKAYQKLHQFHKDAMFSTWLVRIGINEALQLHRKHKKHQIENAIEKKTKQIPDTTSMNPEIKAIYKESTEFIEEANRCVAL